jgi:predicted nucleic acid-binding protein
MRKRVYIETTIPSFYYTLRSDPESVARMHWTRQWWGQYSEQSELLSSAAVVAKLQRGSGEQTEARIALVSQMELLEISAEVNEIVRIYIERLVMPNDPAGDALHLALASFHRVDVLLTWNCLHQANPNKMQHIQLVNYELGLPTPILATPLNYIGGDEFNG